MVTSRSEELNSLLTNSRARLSRMVQLRMDARLRGRIDESDIIQEAYTEAASRFDEFCESRNCSPFVWLRFLTIQKLAQLHRHHIKVQARSVNREVRPRQYKTPPATSIILAGELIGKKSTPVESVIRHEAKQRLATALDQLKDSDREILAMRHFEQMTNQETAEALEISAETAYKRYVRALKRLKSELGESALSIFNAN